MSNTSDRKSWIEFLEDEEIAFIKRFVLAGGSLKDLAAVYGVTYPTVRLRLDRLIAKVQIFDRQDIVDDFERVLRGQFAEGKIDAATFKRLLTAYHQQVSPTPENIHETSMRPRVA